MPPLENKLKTNEIEEIEVTAEEGGLWVEGVVPSLREEEDEEDEEVIVQVKQPQVQALPAIVVDENYIKESRSIPIEGRLDKQETSTTVTLVPLPPKQAHEDQMNLQKDSILKVDDVKHVDFIGVDKYDFHPNYQPGSFFNELKLIKLKHGLKFDEFRLSKKAMQQIARCGLNQIMLSLDSRTNLREEKRYDMIRFSSTMVVHGILNDDPHIMNHKDRAQMCPLTYLLLFKRFQCLLKLREIRKRSNTLAKRYG
ncbi:hypothetical protein LguiB_018313 [Lonicera macranthoides]